MSEGLNGGFSQENIERIYRGEPALVEGRLPSEVLSAERWEVVSLLVDGLNEREIRQEMDLDARDVRLHVAFGLSKLGVSSRSQLAGYFPLPPEHPATLDKGLADLSNAPLKTLQRLSVGTPHEDVPHARQLSQMKAQGKWWPGIGGTLALTQVANALRARSVQAVEAHLGTLDSDYLREFELPVVAALEPSIARLFG